MFSFFKFLNSKSDDKNKESNTLNGKTLNLNSPEARALNIFNNKSPIARKTNGSNNFPRTDCKDTVTSPGFSFRIAQKAREMRSTTPSMDESSLSTSYILENSLNGCNLINGNNMTRDVYDKKRKLMESLDNFGIRKRIRQEASVDSFVHRRRRNICESKSPLKFLTKSTDLDTVLNGHNQRLSQPNSKCIAMENKKCKRQGDFETNICLSQKKPRTRNNEILSSYSSSKFLQTPGQKRPYHNDHEDESPKRKHCKSCTCCGSTIIIDSDQNNPNKRDKTTETDSSDDLVTVAASRIFNRSGKTQVVKKISIKNILDEVFDDIDPVPYTSIEKLQEKKKIAQEKIIAIEHHTDKSTIKNSNKSIDTSPVIVTSTSKFNEIQPEPTSVLSTTSSSVSVSSTTVISPLVQPTVPLTLGLISSESTPKVIEEKNCNSSQFSFDSSLTSPISLAEGNHKQSNEVDKNTIKNKVSEPNNILTSSAQVPSDDQHSEKSNKDNQSVQLTVSGSKLSEPAMKSSSTSDDSSKTNENNVPIIQFGSPNSKKEAVPSIQFGGQVENTSKQPSFTFGVPKTDEKPSTPTILFGVPKVDDKQSTTLMQFGSPKVDDKQSTPVMQFGSPKVDDKQSTPVLQFGLPKTDEKQSTPIIQFSVPNEDNKQSTPVMQFGTSKVDGKQSTPVMQFGISKVNDKQSTPVMQFGASKVDEKQSTSVLQFGASKTDQQSTPTLQFGSTEASNNNPISTPALFSFGSSNQKANENTKPTESVKFQFGSSKPDNQSLTEPKNNVVFGSNNLQNQNIFNFGKTENKSLVSSNPPKYDEKSTPKLQFGALPAPVFGPSNADSSNPQFNSANQLIDNQGSKIVFGNQITENKVPTSNSTMTFGNNNTANSMFQFNGSKLNDKPSEVSNSSFQFSSTKPVSSFVDKAAFQFNVQKTKEPNSQFSSSSFGSQSTSTAPFKFGSSDKPATFGSTGTTFSSNQPLQFANNTEKTEPFKFGSTVASTNAFQFSTNKTDNAPVKFGQISNTFSTPGFSTFGNSTSQQTTFGNVSPPQPSPFGNMSSPTAAAPTFGSVASPSSNTFGTNQSFQFGSTNNNPSSSSTFAFSGNAQPSKPEGAFNFNASSSTTTSPFQFGQASSSTPQFGGTQTQAPFGFSSPPMTATVMPGSSQSLFSMGAPPAGERRKAKAVRRRQ